VSGFCVGRIYCATLKIDFVADFAKKSNACFVSGKPLRRVCVASFMEGSLMGDEMRWRYGDTSPVPSAVDANTVIEIGDIVYGSKDEVWPASMQPHQPSTALDQELLAVNFFGVAMQRSRAGDTFPIRVATTGVFEFDCASSTFELGDYIGACRNVACDALLNQQVVRVSEKKYAIGRAARLVSPRQSRVLVDIKNFPAISG